jgi:cell division protein FtsB
MKIRTVLFKILIALLFVYLAWQLIYSKNGTVSLFKLSRDKEKLVVENKDLENQKALLEKKVGRMKSKSLDLDTLDEQARRNLGYSKDDDVIYIE